MRFILIALVVLGFCGAATAQGVATVTQTSTGSEAYIEQVAPGGGLLQATVTQSGTGHWASQEQTGSLGTAGITGLIEQAGSGHEAEQIQIGGVSVYASVFQSGSFNQSFQTQEGYDLHNVVSQIGSQNLATVTQAGAGHTALVTQTGNNNTATVIQRN